jgi:hypothetical protein
MRSSEDRIGLKSGWFRTMIPYSVSIPITFGSAMNPPLADGGSASGDTASPTSGRKGVRRRGGGARPPPRLRQCGYATKDTGRY